MGQTLSEPNTAKATTSCRNSKFSVASSCMQGWRVSMEDSHTHILSLPDDPDASFFGVYDGHGGKLIAEYAGTHLHKYITNRKEYKDGDIVEALKQGFLELDNAMADEESLKKEPSGTTAVTVVIKGNQLYCANVGDSRAVACIGGKHQPLSTDHKPEEHKERQRIEAAGGWVDNCRVNGNLALSRALGDYVFKKNPNKKPEEQIVTAYPDVTVHTITPDWDFVILACDGIWDVMTNYEVVDYVVRMIAKGLQPEKICENLMMSCLAPDLQMAGLGCDNMTVVLVTFLHDTNYEQLRLKCEKYKEDPWGDYPVDLEYDSENGWYSPLAPECFEKE